MKNEEFKKHLVIMKCDQKKLDWIGTKDLIEVWNTYPNW